MIFVTVGTHHEPFDRLLAALGGLPVGEVVVQHGTGAAPAGVARAVAFMPFDEMVECFRAADVVVTHAGVGSILCARREGHTPLVVPRRGDLGEHVDDHQLELTRALAEHGTVVPVLEVERLAAAVAAAPPRGPAQATAEPGLARHVRQALLGGRQRASSSS